MARRTGTCSRNTCVGVCIYRFINARRRIVQPMIDQSNRAGISVCKMTRSPNFGIVLCCMLLRTSSMYCSWMSISIIIVLGCYCRSRALNSKIQQTEDKPPNSSKMILNVNWNAPNTNRIGQLKTESTCMGIKRSQIKVSNVRREMRHNPGTYGRTYGLQTWWK